MAITDLFGINHISQIADRGIPFGASSSGAITRGNLVIMNGMYGNKPTFQRASSAAAATARGLIGISTCNATASNQDIEVVEYYVMRDIDTSLYAVGGYVYLSTAGGISNTAGAVPVKVGVCIYSHATAGVVVLNPTNVTGIASGLGIDGTDYVSWTVNLDAAAGTAENPFVALLGGDGGVDLVRTDLVQDSAAETLTYRQRRTGTYVSPTFNIGRVAETTASLTSTLNLYATNAGSVVRALNVSCSGTAIGLTGNNLTNPAAGGNSLTMATGNTTASTGANQVSGFMSLVSGDTTQNGAFANASSGNILIGSGSTTCGAAGGAGAASGQVQILSGNTAQANAASAGAASGTWIGGSGNVTGASLAGANSGNVSLRSGNVTDTAGGASGTANLFTGTSAAGNTGNTNVYTGAPTTVTATSGTLNLYTGAIGAGAGVSGNVAIATGNVGGAGTSGDITMTTGTTAGGTRGDITMTSDQINLRPVTDANLLNDIPVLMGTTDQWRLEYDTGVGAPFRFILEGQDYGGVADTASSAFLCETGTTAPTTVVANTGNMTLRSGACASVGAVNFGAGSTGAWVGGSGDTAQTTAAGIGQASGPVSLFSGASTVSFAGATGGASGGWTGGSGACTTSVDAAGSGASGTVALYSGDTLTRVVGTSPASGTVSLYSGATVSNNAGATAGVTGDVSVYSGASTSTLGTSGSSGTANLYTGASEDANTGIVNIYSGNAAAVGGAITSGNVAIRSGTVGGTGTTGTVSLASGAPAGAGTSGNVTLTTGAPVGGGTSGNIGLTVGAVAGAYTQGSATLTRQGLAGDIGATVYHPATDSSAGTGDVESFFDRNVSIPAYALKAGSVIRVKWKVERTGINAADTIVCRVGIGPNAGGAVTIVTSTTAAHAAGTLFMGQAELIVKATGAPGTFDAMGMFHDFGAAGTAIISAEVDGGNVDTTVANIVGVTFDFSTANAGNTAVLQMFTVDLIIP